MKGSKGKLSIETQEGCEVDVAGDKGIRGGGLYGLHTVSNTMISRNWELTAPWTGARIMVPTKFVVGDLDLTFHLPGVQDYVVLEGVTHFLQQEKPEENNKHIYDFICQF